MPQSQNVHKLPPKTDFSALVVTNPLADGLFLKNLHCSKNILTKLVSYQQPTYLCVKMEFVVGTISLFPFM